MSRTTQQFQGFCPLCGEHIPQERFVNGLPICACGWRDEAPARRAFERNEKQITTAFVVVAMTSSVALMHLFSWGSHALTIPGLKIGSWTGMLSPAGYRELARNCMDLGKAACAEDAFLDLYAKGRDAEGLALLGTLQAREGKIQEASINFAKYFQVGGKSPDAMVVYGKLLETSGQVEPALKYYDGAAAARPEQLPVAATTGAVRLLIGQRRLEEAYLRLVQFHSSAENAKGYLNAERTNLENWLGAKSASAIQARVQASQASLQQPVKPVAARRG